METKQVGPTLLVAAMLALAIPALGAHPDYHHDEISHDIDSWTLVSGDIAHIVDAEDGPDPTKVTYNPNWLRLQDDNGLAAGHSLAHKDAATINENLTDYEVKLTMERGEDFTAPGDVTSNATWIGVAFGLQADGHFLWAMNTDAEVMSLSVPDGAGNFTVLETATYLGSPAYTALAHIDYQHRYEVIVQGRDITLRVDGYNVTSYDLDQLEIDHARTIRDPTGLVGVAAGPDTQVFVAALTYHPYDETAPVVTIVDRPTDGNLTIAGTTSVPWIGSDAAVAGESFSFAAEVTDDVLGLKSISVFVDGKKRHDLSIYDPLTVLPGGVYQWTINTSDLGPIGTHKVSVQAGDVDGNRNLKGDSFVVTVIDVDPLDRL